MLGMMGLYRALQGAHFLEGKQSLLLCFPTVTPSTMFQARSEKVLIYQASPLSPLTSNTMLGVSLSLKEVCVVGGGG